MVEEHYLLKKHKFYNKHYLPLLNHIEQLWIIM